MKLLRRNLIAACCLAVAGILFVACTDEDDIVYSPKPRGYCRIDFPAKAYKVYDSLCPFKFEIPVYSHIAPSNYKNSAACNLNLEFPKFRATLYLGYMPINNNLSQYIEDSHFFASKHQVKATGMDEIAVLRDSAKVYGLLFDIAGNTASSLHFYLTDSTTNFLHGSLLFNSVPNIDSLKIVVDFLKKDVLHLINTTSWKKEGHSTGAKK